MLRRVAAGNGPHGEPVWNNDFRFRLREVSTSTGRKPLSANSVPIWYENTHILKELHLASAARRYRYHCSARRTVGDLSYTIGRIGVYVFRPSLFA